MNLDEMTLEELRAEVARLREEYEPWAGKLCECGKPATQLFYGGRPICYSCWEFEEGMDDYA